MSPDYGWNEHVDKTGTPCGWCGKPSTHTLVIEGDQFKLGELVKRGKRIGVCDEHHREPEDLPAAVTFRRRKAQDVGQQLGMDVGDGKGSSAIYGDEAA